MSIGGSFSGVSFTGLGSGIDSDSIIRQIIQVEALPISRLQNQQARLRQRQDVYSQLKSALDSFTSAAGVLNSRNSYNAISASSTDKEVATLTASSSALAGTYELTVSKLAKAHKVTSAAQSDVSSELGLTGSFVVNGIAVDVESADSLTSIAKKINSTGSGVTASLINGGTGNSYITLTSSTTGADSQIQLADLSGSVLGSLDLVSGAAAFRDQVDSDSVRSFGFSSSTSDLDSILGSTASGSVTIGSTPMAVDFANDSLQDIADRINALGESETATVVSVEEGGETVYKLEITGSGGLPAITDTNGLFEALGVFQKGFSNELVAAQDAEYTLDGINLTSSTNSVTEAIPGVTLKLLTADETTPKTATLNLVRDTSAIENNVKAFQKAFNDLITLIDQNSQFDEESFASGPLFGDTVAGQVEDRLTSVLFNTLPTGTLKNLTQIGFGFDEDNKLTLDTGALQSAIADDPEAVRKLLMATGTSSATKLSYISAGTDTVDSGAGSYAVDITQIATLGNTVASTAQTLANAGGEKLTFSGALFGSSSIDLFVDFGSSLSDLIDKINSDDRFKDLVVASDDGGSLKIESKKYGTGGNFSVVSNLAAAADNSGIGTEGEATVTDGLDIAGTINGEAATGKGQFLTGDDGNATTDGLQVQYTGNTLGLAGSITFSRGIASRTSSAITSFTDSVAGLLSVSGDAIQTQIDDIDLQVARLQDSLAAREAFLRQQFLAMERSVSALQTQIAQLGAIQGQG